MWFYTAWVSINSEVSPKRCNTERKGAFSVEHKSQKKKRLTQICCLIFQKSLKSAVFFFFLIIFLNQNLKNLADFFFENKSKIFLQKKCQIFFSSNFCVFRVIFATKNKKKVIIILKEKKKCPTNQPYLAGPSARKTGYFVLFCFRSLSPIMGVPSCSWPSQETNHYHNFPVSQQCFPLLSYLCFPNKS